MIGSSLEVEKKKRVDVCGVGLEATVCRRPLVVRFRSRMMESVGERE